MLDLSISFLELRALVADFQRDVTSRGVTSGNGEVLEGADNHLSHLVPGDSLWTMAMATACSLAFLSALTISCFLKSNTHLYLACPFYVLQHGQGQQLVMTLVWDTALNDWLYEILLSMATNSNRFAVSLLLRRTHSRWTSTKEWWMGVSCEW